MVEPTITVALAGDTMLGRGVADAIRRRPEEPLVSQRVADLIGEADLFLLNLECCISDRGSPRTDPWKAFLFRAPSTAARLLQDLGVSCVTIANNHILDFGEEALLDTLRHLEEAGIQWVGAGRDVRQARRPAVLGTGAFRLSVLGLADDPADFAAAADRPGTAFANLKAGVPRWVAESVAAGESDAVLVTPHWGPNMRSEPLPYVRSAARSLIEAGATFVAGHSAHVFHGVEGRVVYDLGDFLDDYTVDPVLRNDLGLLFFVTLAASGPIRLEAVPLKLEYCFTRLADGEDAAWITGRFRESCAKLGTAAREEGGRLVVTWPDQGRTAGPVEAALSSITLPRATRPP